MRNYLITGATGMIGSSIVEQIIKNNAKIEKNQVELDKNAQEITAKKSEISEQESTISNSETLLASLEGALSKLPAPSGKPEDREKDAQLSAKKNELTKQISEKKKDSRTALSVLSMSLTVSSNTGCIARTIMSIILHIL